MKRRMMTVCVLMLLAWTLCACTASPVDAPTATPEAVESTPMIEAVPAATAEAIPATDVPMATEVEDNETTDTDPNDNAVMGLEQYTQQLNGTWTGDNGNVYAFNEDGSGTVTNGTDVYQERWVLAEPVGAYTYILLLHESSASMAVDFYVTYIDDQRLSVLTVDGQTFQLAKE